MRVGGIWYDNEGMFWENLTGGMSLSVFGIATGSCEIICNMIRLASVLRYDRLRHLKCNNMLLTLEVFCSG
jgi:hypothetical protein